MAVPMAIPTVAIPATEYGARANLAAGVSTTFSSPASRIAGRESPPLQPVTLVKQSCGRYSLEPAQAREPMSGGYNSAAASTYSETRYGGYNSAAVSMLPPSPGTSDWGATGGVTVPALPAPGPGVPAEKLALPPSLPLRNGHSDAVGGNVALDADSVDRLRGKLHNTASSFAGLDKRVEEDSWKRREMEQKRMEDMAAYIVKLEKSLSVEIRNQADASRDGQQHLDQVLADMVEHVQSRISVRFDRLTQSAEELSDRCSTLERGIQQFKGRLPSKLQMDTSSIARDIKKLASDLDGDTKVRAESDANMLRRITEFDYSVDHRMEQELTHLQRRSEALQELIEEFASADDLPEAVGRREAFADRILELKASLTEELQVRERTDDQVVQAINDYTNTLHRSLCAANQ